MRDENRYVKIRDKIFTKSAKTRYLNCFSSRTRSDFARRFHAISATFARIRFKLDRIEVKVVSLAPISRQNGTAAKSSFRPTNHQPSPSSDEDQPREIPAGTVNAICIFIHTWFNARCSLKNIGINTPFLQSKQEKKAVNKKRTCFHYHHKQFRNRLDGSEFGLKNPRTYGRYIPRFSTISGSEKDEFIFRSGTWNRLTKSERVRLEKWLS